MRPSSKVIARFAIYPVSLCAFDQRTLCFFLGCSPCCIDLLNWFQFLGLRNIVHSPDM